MNKDLDKPMTDRELRERLKAIDHELKQKPNSKTGVTGLCILFLLFLGGCFKGCGY
jgi:hypothetical protein